MNEVANSNGQRSGAVALSPMPQERNPKSLITETMRQWCLHTLGGRLEAVVLTGSLARDEATWQQTDHGVRFLSDAEFIVILSDKAAIPSQAQVTLICSGAEEELRNNGVLCKLSFGAVHESFLLNLGETIFGYELLTCGEVVYGDPEILLSRARSVTGVSQEDAWRLLANRTVELLEIVPELVNAREPLSEAAQYRLTKLYCDMATSILVFQGEFVAGYKARAAKLCQLHEQGLLSGLPFNECWFVDVVGRSTKSKITHSWEGPSPFSTLDSVQQAITVLDSLWTWELAQIHGATLPSAYDMLRLHMQKQSLKARLRGWAYAARRRGALDSLRHCWRWLRLLQSASPRYCVYAAGLQAVSSFKFPVSSTANTSRLGQLETQNSKLETISRWLPIVNFSVRTLPDEKDLAEAVLSNYREFLVETRS